MGMITVSCPSCGFSRKMAAEKVPDGPRRVTCPHCKEIFVYDKSASIAVNDADSLTGSVQASASDPPFTQPLQPDASSASLDETQIPAVEGSSSTSSESPPGPPTAPVMTDIGDLFRLSWELYQKRFATLILLYLLTILAIVIPTALAVGLSFFMTLLAGGTAYLVTVFLGILVGIASSLWCYSGFLCAVVDDTLRLEDALARGKKMILPLAWILLLYGFIITGGYLLLIIPGVIFTVWFALTLLIMPSENVCGMEALLKSREYVRGHWLDVALRLFLIWVVSGVVSAIPFFGFILALFFFPYVMIFHYLIYRDLRSIKGDISFPCGTKNKLLWPGVALAGWIIIPVILTLLFGPLFCNKFHQGNSGRIEATRGGGGQFSVTNFPLSAVKTANRL